MAEALHNLDSDKHQEIVEHLQKKDVHIINFCSKSANICARITKARSEKKKIPLSKDAKNIKADMKILANAQAYKIDVVYTYDEDFAKLSEFSSTKVSLVNKDYPFSKQPVLNI